MSYEEDKMITLQNSSTSCLTDNEVALDYLLGKLIINNVCKQKINL
jgi:hypothetical protein